MEHRFETRGRVADETIEVLRRCWAGGEVDYEGEFFSFRHVNFEPVPVQPRLPIWVGGDSGPALRRAARYADVWHPHDLTPDEVARKGDRLDELAGRRVARSVRIASAAQDLAGLPDAVDAYLGVGCTRVVLDFRSLAADVVAVLAEKAAASLFE
jgi:alkanesulfonate monooxygenase SsuD/methylene tetrahydromethanopterin reductase-like flavin-dependent oxidoreductase (luciferase family)